MDQTLFISARWLFIDLDVGNRHLFVLYHRNPEIQKTQTHEKQKRKSRLTNKGLGYGAYFDKFLPIQKIEYNK